MLRRVPGTDVNIQSGLDPRLGFIPHFKTAEYTDAELQSFTTYPILDSQLFIPAPKSNQIILPFYVAAKLHIEVAYSGSNLLLFYTQDAADSGYLILPTTVISAAAEDYLYQTSYAMGVTFKELLSNCLGKGLYWLANIADGDSNNSVRVTVGYSIFNVETGTFE